MKWDVDKLSAAVKNDPDAKVLAEKLKKLAPGVIKEVEFFKNIDIKFSLCVSVAGSLFIVGNKVKSTSDPKPETPSQVATPGAPM